MREKPSPQEQQAFRVFAMVMNRPKLYLALTRMGRMMQNFHPLVKGKRVDPLYPWTQSREFPKVARQTFREYWDTRK